MTANAATTSPFRKKHRRAALAGHRLAACEQSEAGADEFWQSQSYVQNVVHFLMSH